MAEWRAAHQPEDNEGGLVPSGAHARRLPLLPYEKQICELTGINEENYAAFKQELLERNHVRPAAYDLIPDIRNEPATLTAVLINLAIGIAFTAIGYLLTPKPPGSPEEVKQKQLGSTKGRERYAPIYGFDSLAEIAAYGEAIPLVWTRYTGTTGGVVITPKLIWSRVYSWGGFQTAKFLFTAGVFGVDRPDLEGIWLGNNSLNIVDQTHYAFYWRTQATGDLIKHYGTDVGRNSGDPSGNRFPSFCQAYTPSNNTTFGVSNAVPNGTNYRVNWRIISLAGQDRDSDGFENLRQERKKVCGYVGNGMPGVGAGYPRRQGLINSNTFRISGHWISGKTFGEDVTEDDINSELDSECIAADELFQVGEKILIAGRLFSVTARDKEVFVPKNKRGSNAINVQITLETEEDVDPGFTPRTVNKDSIEANGLISRDNELVGSEGALYGIGYDPAVRYTPASIRTTRNCDAIEIGIKSNVWARFNGICKFKTLPFPPELVQYDNDNIQTTNGTMTQYFMRTSVFTIRYRKPDNLGVYPDTWQSSGVLFAIRGSRPQDQYNFIRLEQSDCGQIEYQFTPLTGASIVRRNDSAPIYWLYSKIYDPDGGASTVLSVSLGGGITAVFAGKQLQCIDCQAEAAMIQESDKKDQVRYKPTDGDWQGYRSDALYVLKEAWMWEVFKESNNRVTNGTIVGKVLDFKNYDKPSLILSVLFRAEWRNNQWNHVSQAVYDPASSNISKSGATDALGRALQPWQKPQNNTSVSSRWMQSTSGKPAPVYYHCLYTALITDENPWHAKNYGQNGLPTPYWINARMGVQNNPPVDPSSDYRERAFESNTQCMEVSHYGSLITRSCDSSPEHQIVVANEIRRNLSPSREGLTLCGLSIKSSRNFTAAEQLNLWIGLGTRNSNSYPELVAYLLEKAAQTSNLDESMVDHESLTAASTYCDAHSLYFDGVISDRQNLRSFIESTAPMFLLNMVIKNGKIGLQPAIPTTSEVAMFTAGNILAGSFKLDYIPESSRRPTKVAVTYRSNPKNQLPRTMTVVAAWADQPTSPMEQLDMTAFCTSFEHATKVARYLMAIRRYTTKSISFQTVPDQATIGPGDFIQVALEQTTTDTGYLGAVSASGAITTPVQVPDGSYEAVFYKEGQTDLQRATITVSEGSVTTPEAWGSLFAVQATTVTAERFIVDQVELTQEGLVVVQASEFPDDIATATFDGDGITLTPSTPDGC